MARHTNALAAGIYVHGDTGHDGGGTGGRALRPHVRLLPGLLSQLILPAVVGCKGQQGPAQPIHLLQCHALCGLAQLLKTLQAQGAVCSVYMSGSWHPSRWSCYREIIQHECDCESFLHGPRLLPAEICAPVMLHGCLLD